MLGVTGAALGAAGSALGIYDFLSGKLTKDETIIKKQIINHLESIYSEVNREHNTTGETKNYEEIITEPMTKVINEAVIGLFDRREHLSKESIKAELDKVQHDIPDRIQEQLLERLELGLAISFKFFQINFNAWLERSLDEISNKTDEILKKMPPTNSVTSPAAPAPDFPPENPNFTGRKEALDKLKVTFETKNKFALVGSGGFGKTQIAVKYAYENLDSYNYIWLVNADDEGLLVSSYREFAMHIGITGAGDMEPDEIVRWAKGWLAANDGWLFIYDNAEGIGEDELQKYLPSSTTKGHIIICTWETEYGYGIDKYHVEVFTEAEASDFLKNTITNEGKTITDEEATQISERLGHHPLALNLAAFYISKSKRATCAELINELEKKGVEFLVLPERRQKVFDYKKVITFVLQKPMDELDSEAAKQLINLCAYCAPDHIPLEMFIDGAEYLPSPLKEELEPEINHIVDELCRYGLMTFKERDSQYGFLSVHRLVQEVLRDVHAGDNRWLACCLKIICDTFRYGYGDMVSMVKFRHSVLHFAQIADYGSIAFVGDEEWQERIAWIYNAVGFGMSHEGEYPKALVLHNKALAIREKILGLEHPDTATTYNNIAALYDNQGNHPKALGLYNKALAINEKALGLEHPDTATIYHNIAGVYNNQGNHPKALGLYNKALAIREKILGLEHPDTATTYNNIAGVYDNQGNYTKALELYNKALVIYEKVLGLEHPDTAMTYNNIAFVYNNQGDYPKALKLYLKSYAIALVKLGIDHPNTQITKRNMEHTYSKTNPNKPFEEWLLEQNRR